MDANAPPPGISAGSVSLRQRASAVTALAWTAPAGAPHPWLASAHAGGEVDIFSYDMNELLPGATISFGSPSAALALAWDPHRQHVLVTGASDQTVRGWNVTLPKYAHPDAQAPLLLAADDGSEAAATSVDGEEPAQEAAVGQASNDQESTSVRPDPATGDAAARSAPAAASTDPAVGEAKGSAASGTSPGAAATEVGSGHAAPSEQPAAELQHPQCASSDSAEALAREPSATGLGTRAEVSTAEASTKQPDSQQPSGTAAGAVAVGELPAQPAADVSPEQQDTTENTVSRPVDLAEVAAIRSGRAAPPAKSPMRAAASLGVGSVVGRLRREEAADDKAAATDPLAATADGGVSGGPADGVEGHTADTVREPGGRDEAAGSLEESATQSAADSGKECGGGAQTEAADVSTSIAVDTITGRIPAAEALPREGARPTPGVMLPLHPLFSGHTISFNLPSM